MKLGIAFLAIGGYVALLLPDFGRQLPLEVEWPEKKRLKWTLYCRSTGVVLLFIAVWLSLPIIVKNLCALCS